MSITKFEREFITLEMTIIYECISKINDCNSSFLWWCRCFKSGVSFNYDRYIISPTTLCKGGIMEF